MNRVEITFKTGHFKGPMYQPGVGTTNLEFEVVKGMQISQSTPLDFANYTLPTEGSGIDTLLIDEAKAIRMQEFGQTHFVEGRGSFDCRAFLGYVMGWDAEVSTQHSWIYKGRYVRPEDTKADLPYQVAVTDGGTAPHSILGIDRPGQSLGVAGFECPLIIARNGDLMKAFGGVALLEIDTVEKIETDHGRIEQF